MDSEANESAGGGAHQPAPIRPTSTLVSAPVSALKLTLAVAPLLTQHEQIQPLHLLARPRRFAQKTQAGGDAGVHIEAAQLDTVAQAGPAVVIHQLGHDALQRDAVQGVAGLLLWGGRHAPIVAQRRGGLWGRGLWSVGLACELVDRTGDASGNPLLRRAICAGVSHPKTESHFWKFIG